MKPEFAEVRTLFDRVSNIAIISHLRPDGDAIGSLLGLARSLQLTGKRVTCVSVDGVPEKLRFLPGAGDIQRKLPAEFDALIVVDVSNFDRIGIPNERLPRKPDLNIDHHPTNTRFAVLNLVEPEASASAEILYDLLLALGFPLDVDVATSLLTGMITDTIGFRTANVSARTLKVAAELVELGAPLSEIYELSLYRRSFEAARFWGLGLSKLERQDAMLWTTLTLNDRHRSSYPGRDDADLINMLTTIEDVEVTIVFVEQDGGKVKVSWRSRSELDVASLADTFGGGGHHMAAGAIITGDLDSVKAKVLSATKAVLDPVMEMGK
ncbi:MAG: bifunctional oligoribonuclease/PAP phosphatase NrnA [Anaerolineales bacterium]|nr:bifunctional oligoribonuclease/PAP phosphatase NrnA [Anaerolineales bacterium]